MPDEVRPSEEADETYAPPELSADEESANIWNEAPPVEADGELVVAEEKLKPPESLWDRLKKILFGSPEEIEQRLRSLSLTIEKYPDTPANYVLRGELYLDVNEYELAAADFQRALELASTQFEASDWGGIAQVMRDRAEAGLERVLRHAE